MSRYLKLTAVLSLNFVALGACSNHTTQTAALAPSQPIQTENAPESPQTASIQLKSHPEERKGSVEMYLGNGNFVGSKPVHHDKYPLEKENEGITLNFVNADIHDVSKAVLGDFLKLNYQIEPSAQGNITIQTSQPLKSQAALPVLEQALRLNGLALVEQDGLYKVVTLANAPRLGDLQSRKAPQPGFGVSVVPMRFVSVTEMQHLLEPLAPSGSILQVDPSQNLMMIAGSEQERAALLEEIAMFDVDWLSGMSFALFRPGSVSAKELAAELDNIVGGPNNPIGGMVRLIPMERMNAVLAISAQPRYLEKIRTWVERLDKPNESTDQQLFVYRVQNGRASDLADVLNKVLLGQSNQSAPGTPARGSGNGSSAQATVPMVPDGVAPNPGSIVPGYAGPQGLPPGGKGSIDGADSSDDKTLRMRITADEVNNSLLILATTKEYEIIDAALRQLDAPPLQVLLEAAIAEVTLTSELKYGVQFYLQAGHKNGFTLSNGNSGTISASFPGFAYQFINNGNIAGIISALDSITHVEMLSSPQVLVLNNQTATLQVGDQVPTVTQQAQSTLTSTTSIINSVQYQSTGVILKVTPRVNQGGMVMMDISQEVSAVSTTTSSSIDSPTISQRKISSTVGIRDSETVALGGLITSNKNKSSDGVPVLHSMPILGNLFGSNDDNATRTELLVLITPHVVDNQQRARAVTEELRTKLPAIRDMLKQQEP